MSIDSAKLSQYCEVCGGILTGKQSAFCSRRCKGKAHQSYTAQHNRGLQRKIAFVLQQGGKCVRCGYAKNLAAISFHHRDPSAKLFQLDLRSLSNRTLETIRTEVEKCDLLCANCHAEIHHPHLEFEMFCAEKQLATELVGCI